MTANPILTDADRRSQLEARAAELTARLAGVEAELDSHTSKDWEEMATENENDEVLEGLGQAGQKELAAIGFAIKRIESGEYGWCQTCGARIAEERLDLLPHTPFCRNCAK
jgi:RNA polymerase-binding transcription factor DksA